MTDARNALDTRRQNGDVAQAPTMAKLIRDMEPQFQLAMPKGAEAQQLIRDALTALRTIKGLDKCDPASVLGALMTTAQLDLRIGVLGQAWPIPFKKWNPSTKQEEWHAQLIIGYQGYSTLAHRSDKVRSFMPRSVYENDIFDIDYGINGTLVHKPARGPRGALTGFHAIARYTNDGYDFLYMSMEEMEEHRDNFAMAKKKIAGELTVVGPWRDHFEPMALKTTMRRLAKYMPKETNSKLAVATIVDGGLRVDLNPANPAEEVTEKPTAIEAYADAEFEETAPGTDAPISAGQRKRIMAIADALQMDRDHRISWLGELAKRPITSSNELFRTEANSAIKAMESFAAQQGVTV